MEETILLIAELNRARASTLALLNRLEPMPELFPGWSLKEYLAHLAGWDECTAASLRAFFHGEAAPTPAKIGIDQFNQLSVTARAHLTLPQALADFQQTRLELLSALRNLNTGQFARRLVFPWGQGGSIQEMIEIIIQHELEHAEELEQLLINWGNC